MPPSIKLYDARDLEENIHPLGWVPTDTWPVQEKRGRQTVIVFNNTRIVKVVGQDTPDVF